MKKKLLGLFCGIAGLAVLASCNGGQTPSNVSGTTEPSPTQQTPVTEPIAGGYDTEPTQSVTPTVDPTTVNPTTVPTTVVPTTGTSETTQTTVVIPVEEKIDTLNVTNLNGSGSNYVDWTYTGDSGAEFTGYSAFGTAKSPSIQLRAPKVDDSGKFKQGGAILVTESVGAVQKVEVKFTSGNSQSDRTFDIYGYDELIEDVDSFFAEGLEPVESIAVSKNGTATFEFEEPTNYVAFSATGGAIYIEEIKIYWGEATPEVREPAGQELADAFAAIDTNSYSVSYSYKGTADFAESVFEALFEYNGSSIKATYSEEDEYGDLYEESYYYYQANGLEYLVLPATAFAEEDYGDYGDYEDFDWSTLFGRINNRKNAAEDSVEYVYVDSTDEYFDYYYNQLGFATFTFDALNYTDFEKVGNKYVINAEKANEVGKAVFGDYDYEGEDYDSFGYTFYNTTTEVYTKLEVVLSNGKVATISASSKYNEEDDYGDGEVEVYAGKFNYKLGFVKFGDVDFDIPEAKRYISDPKVSTVYELSDGEEITLTNLWVNGVNTTEKVIYVCDETAAIALHYTSVNEVPVIGASVSTTATVRITGSLYELVASEVTVDNSNPEQMANLPVNTIENKDLTFAGETVDFDLLTLTTKDINNLEVLFTTFDGYEIRLEFTEAEKELVEVLLYEVEEGTSIKLTGVAISYDEYYAMSLRLLDSVDSELANGLVCNQTEFEADLNTEIDEVLADLKVITYINGVKEETTNYGVDFEEYNKAKIGSYLVKITYGSDFETYVTVRVLYSGEVESFVENDGKGIDYATKKYGVTVGLPSSGNVNVLVIPVEFTNAPFATDYKTTLEKGFNGTSEETGWESLRSYYNKVSGGKLNITATVLDKYETNDEYSHQAKTINGKNYPDDFMGNYYSLDYKYIEDAIKYYDGTIDYSQYDANNDGNIDCLYVVYSCPTATGENDLQFWWAYTSEFAPASNEDGSEGDKNAYDGKELDFYMWFSIDFFSEELKVNNEVVELTVNAETVIHETGHALGLDDYYDTSYSYTGGFGGGAMMDWNVGDHDPYSKALLGWITPTVVINKDTTLDLHSFESTGEAIFIAKDYNGVYFNEYYIIDYYTPTGVNELEACSGDYSKGLPSVAGIRIIHVNATPIADSTQIAQIFGVTEATNSDASNMLITIVEADGDGMISQGYTMQNSDLWQASNVASGLKWHDGSDCGFTITVNSIENGAANVTVAFAE